MSSPQQTAILQTFRTSYDAYVKAWGGLSSPAERSPLLDTAVSTAITYCDPINQTTNSYQLEHLMTTQRQSTPTVHFTIDTWTAHHSQAMSQWTGMKDGSKFVAGTDVVLFDVDGRIRAVHSFFHTIDEHGNKVDQP